MDDNAIQVNNDQVKKLEDRVQELENNWKRAVADYRNLQRRTQEEQIAFASFANQVLLRELLPVLDCLEAADQQLGDEGLKLALKKFSDVLKDFKVTEIKALNESFEASKMEAIESVPGDAGKVIAVSEKGYLIGDKLLRAARVKVGKGG